MANAVRAKQLLGREAAAALPEDSVLGIGSGSTVAAFIDALGERIREKPFSCLAVAASESSARLAEGAGLRVVPLETVATIDFAVDGADAVDVHGTLIKGGGAALVRERLIIAVAQQSLILVDDSKPMTTFENVTIPLAVIPFGWSNTRSRLQREAAAVTLRLAGESPKLTDDGLYILDAQFDVIEDAGALHRRLKLIDGVVDTGLFVGYRPVVWVSDGQRVWTMEEAARID